VRAALPPLALCLAALAPAAAADPAPRPVVVRSADVVQAMDGPYADVTQVCAPCTTTARLRHPGAPVREARLIFSGDSAARPTPSNQLRHWLAVRTDAGWWLLELGFSGVICGGRSQSFVSLGGRGLVAHDVIGDRAPEVELDVESSVGSGRIRDLHHDVCAVGSDGTPRCASLFVRRYTDRALDGWDYRLTLRRDGSFRLADRSGLGRAPMVGRLDFR
jgi:hypothetical protein